MNPLYDHQPKHHINVLHRAISVVIYEKLDDLLLFINGLRASSQLILLVFGFNLSSKNGSTSQLGENIALPATLVHSQSQIKWDTCMLLYYHYSPTFLFSLQ